MYRVHADEVDAQVVGLQARDAQAFAQYGFGQPRLVQAARPGKEEHVLADKAFGAADGHLECRRARPARNMAYADTVAGRLFQPRGREIHHDVRRDVARRVMHLVEHLLFHGAQIDAAARAFHLADFRRAVGVHIGIGERQVPRLGHVLVAGVAEIAARDLRAALQQMADAAALAQPRPVVLAPAIVVHHGRQK
ncbi:hypothetical protein D3C72_1589200 [compost metagenome]